MESTSQPQSRFNTITPHIFQSIRPLSTSTLFSHNQQSQPEPVAPPLKNQTFLSKVTSVNVKLLCKLSSSLCVIWVLTFFQIRNGLLQLNKVLNYLVLSGLELFIVIGVLGLRVSYFLIYLVDYNDASNQNKNGGKVTSAAAARIGDGENDDKLSEDKMLFDQLLRFSIVHELYWSENGISFKRNFSDLAIPKRIYPFEILMNFNELKGMDKKQLEAFLRNSSGKYKIDEFNNAFGEKVDNVDEKVRNGFRQRFAPFRNRRERKERKGSSVETPPIVNQDDDDDDSNFDNINDFIRLAKPSPTMNNNQVEKKFDKIIELKDSDKRERKTKTSAKPKVRTSSPSLSMVKLIASPKDIPASNRFNKMFKYGSNLVANGNAPAESN